MTKSRTQSDVATRRVVRKQKGQREGNKTLRQTKACSDEKRGRRSSLSSLSSLSSPDPGNVLWQSISFVPILSFPTFLMIHSFYCTRLTATFQRIWRGVDSGAEKNSKKKKTKKFRIFWKYFWKFEKFEKKKTEKKNNDLVWKASAELDGNTRLDENHVPQVDGWMPLRRWTEN